MVAAARFRFDEPRAAALAEADRALEAAGAAALRERVVTRLSGGEAQAVSLAAMLAQDAPLLLLDEPASHLDPAQQIAAYRFVGSCWRAGRGVLCITHDANLLRHTGAPASGIHVVGLSAGAQRFDLAADDPGLPDALSTLFGIRFRAVPLDDHVHLVAS